MAEVRYREARWQMIYHMHILGKPDANGTALTIANQTYAGRSDDEAIRTAKDILLRNSPPPNAYGFSLKRQDRTEVCRWFNTEAHHAHRS